MTWFSTICVLLTIYILSSACAKLEPEISLLVWIGSDTFSKGSRSSEYLRTQVSHDLDQEAPVTFVNGTTYILTAEVTLIGFMCKAPYPVEWEFSNSKVQYE